MCHSKWLVCRSSLVRARLLLVLGLWTVENQSVFCSSGPLPVLLCPLDTCEIPPFLPGLVFDSACRGVTLVYLLFGGCHWDNAANLASLLHAVFDSFVIWTCRAHSEAISVLAASTLHCVLFRRPLSIRCLSGAMGSE